MIDTNGWALMGGMLHLVQREGGWAHCGPTQAPFSLYQM